MESGANWKMMAIRVLDLLLADCGNLARDLGTATRTCNHLLGEVADYRSALSSERLTSDDLCGLITDLCREIIDAKERNTDFDARYPENIRHLAVAKEVVADGGGPFFPLSGGKDEVLRVEV
jgi:hypothetical protein